MRAGKLHEKVTFARPVLTPDGSGGNDRTWEDYYTCRAEFVYDGGGERGEAGGLQAHSTMKIRLHHSEAARTIAAEHRMTDARRGTIYNVREVDPIPDRLNVWLHVEAGVAV